MPRSTVEQKEEMSCLTIRGMELSNATFNRGTVEEMSCLTIRGMELSNATFNRGTVEEMSCLTIHGMELSNATFNRGTEGRNVMLNNSRYGTK